MNTKKEIINYLRKELEWYENELDKAVTMEEHIQRLSECRLLKRLIQEIL